jgi:Mg-chelatase subunit ChlD
MTSFVQCCYNCGKYGHSKKNCTTVPTSLGFLGTCYTCGQVGHSKKNCSHTGSVAGPRIKIVKSSRALRSSLTGIVAGTGAGVIAPGGIAIAVTHVPRGGAVGLQVQQQQQTMASAVPKVNTVDWYAVIDVSSSMAGERLNAAKMALKNDIEPLMAADDRMAIVTFDTDAYFRLKPRAVGQLRGQHELEWLLARMFAHGCTALWDALWLVIEQLRDKQRKTVLTVLTDGEDNASQHTQEELMTLLAQHVNVTMSIVHIGTAASEPYKAACRVANGVYSLVADAEEVGYERCGVTLE